MINSGMPDDRIVDNINTMIGGGFDTTVLPIALTLHELGKRPDLQQTILNEVCSIVGDQLLAPITLNQLNDMTYLNCVIKEAVRLFFSGPFIDRLLTKDLTVKNITIPKGTTVICHLAEVLKSEKYFENPKAFYPERFLPENINEKAQRAFVSFGFGAKSCPGKKISTTVMKLFIAKILREFAIHSVESDQEIQFQAEITFRSVNGIPIMFKKRILPISGHTLEQCIRV